MKVMFLTLVVFVAAALCYRPKNYCSKKLCSDNVNSACNTTGYWGASCLPNVRFVKFSDSDKQVMLDTLNYHRAGLAVGSHMDATGAAFEPATKMSELMWDEEQAFMASLQIKTCLSHDPCHNTWYDDVNNRLIHTGQNLYYDKNYNPTRPPLETIIVYGVNRWFEEINAAPASSVHNIQFSAEHELGHFFTMSHDKTTTVGCVATQWEGIPDKDGIPLLTRITCNFNLVPFVGRVLYETGDACSACSTSCNYTDNNYQLCIVDPSTIEYQYKFNDTV